MSLGPAACARGAVPWIAHYFSPGSWGRHFVAIAFGMLINLDMYEGMISEALHTGILFSRAAIPC
jgi:hypothetical protein